jgi:hypothetical protein
MDSNNAGVKHDAKKPDFSLIPVAAMLEEAHLWTDGKVKYAEFNWHKGLSYRRILSAIERHLYLLKAGIDFDYETKRHHAAAIRCGCAMLIQFTLEEREELDDRMKLQEIDKNKIEAMIQGESLFDILGETGQPNKALRDLFNK